MCFSSDDCIRSYHRLRWQHPGKAQWEKNQLASFITFFLILAHGDRCVLPLLHFSLGTQRALLSPSPHSGLPVSDSFICLYQPLPRLLWTHLSPHTPTIMLIKGLPHVRPRQGESTSKNSFVEDPWNAAFILWTKNKVACHFSKQKCCLQFW